MVIPQFPLCINYLGTMDQWKKIVKASQSIGSNIKKIICSDGTIELKKILEI